MHVGGERLEPTQEFLLHFMQDLGFTEEDIEANRSHNGRLFLTPRVVLGIRYGSVPVGKQIDVLKGDFVDDVVPFKRQRK
jgi:hypothetical protein